MGLDGEQVLDEIVLDIFCGGLRFHALEAFSAAPLQAVFGSGGALDVTAVREGHDHCVVCNEIFHRNLADFCKDRALTRSGVLGFDRL